MSKKNKKELEPTYLVQRLAKPYPVTDSPLSQLGNLFSFGGGLKNGGLSDDAMQLLSPLFRFDYMGSAEFEWGAVPESFRQIAKERKDYALWEYTIYDTTFYVIAEKSLKEEVNAVIKKLADKKLYLKESSGVDVACGKSMWTTKEQCQYIGWLELNNNFLFFTDKNTAESIISLFEIEKL